MEDKIALEKLCNKLLVLRYGTNEEEKEEIEKNVNLLYNIIM